MAGSKGSGAAGCPGCMRDALLPVTLLSNGMCQHSAELCHTLFHVTLLLASEACGKGTFTSSGRGTNCSRPGAIIEPD